MAGEYPRVPVSDVATPVIGGTPSRRISEYWGGTVRWATAKDITSANGRYIYNTEEGITQEGIENSAARILPKGTIVITARGTVGALARLGQDMSFNQTCYGLVANQNVMADYLYYVLKGTLSEMRALSYGTVFATITTITFSHWEIPLPNISEQRAIAHVLGTLDDKIELNHRMNETLEAMARAVFKSWFVSFEPVRAKAEDRDTGLPKEIADFFPNKFEESELGEIPEGWRVAKLREIAQIIDCLHSKKPERRKSGLPLLQLWNIRDDGLIDMTDTYCIDEADYHYWIARMEASPGDCVITNVGRVGAVAQIPDGLNAALGRNMTGIQCKQSFQYSTFIIECLRSEAMRNEIVLRMDTGTILDALNVRNIPKLRFVIPNAELLHQFEKMMRPLRRSMERNHAESHSLSALRDAFLPKLISGDIRIPTSITGETDLEET